jgi:hypothetical protein
MNVILLAYICDVRMCLRCLITAVAAISWLVLGWQDAAPDDCQPWLVPGCNRQASR